MPPDSREAECVLVYGRQLLPAGDLEGLSARLDEIMLGHGAPPAKQLTFQLDQGGSYTRSDMGVHQGPTRDYRRIEGLEHEPLVAAFLAHPLIDQIFNRYYGDTVRLALAGMGGTASLWTRGQWTRRL